MIHKFKPGDRVYVPFERRQGTVKIVINYLNPLYAEVWVDMDMGATGFSNHIETEHDKNAIWNKFMMRELEPERRSE
jgi:hypothetical protein